MRPWAGHVGASKPTISKQAHAMKQTVWLLGAWLAACGSSGTAAEPTAPVSTVTAPEPVSEPQEPAVAVVETPRPEPEGPFADSPITPLANELIQVVRAALASEPLPRVSFPIETVRQPDRLVTGDKESLPADVEFVALAMELEFSVGPRGSSTTPGPGGSAPGGLELGLFLSRHGLKLIELKADQVSSAIPAPSWLPVHGLAQEILSDVQQDRMERWWLGDAEKEMLGADIAKEIERDERKQPDRLRKARKRVAGKTRVHGFEIDDVTLIAKDSQQRIWGLRMQFESGDQPELDSHPLVRVRKPRTP